MRRDYKLESLVRIAEKKLIKKLNSLDIATERDKHAFYMEVLLHLDQIKETYQKMTGQTQEDNGFDYDNWQYKIR